MANRSAPIPRRSPGVSFSLDGPNLEFAQVSPDHLDIVCIGQRLRRRSEALGSSMEIIEISHVASFRGCATRTTRRFTLRSVAPESGFTPKVDVMTPTELFGCTP